MKNIVMLFLIFILSFVFFGCPDRDCCDSSIIIKNNSDIDVIYWDYFSKTDTSLNTLSSLPAGLLEELTIKSKMQKKLEGDFISSLRNKNNIYRLILISRDTFDNIPLEDLKNKYLVLKRYDLSLEDLKRNNWIVIYP